MVFIAFFSVDAHAQFKADAFTQQYNSDKTGNAKDSTATLFSFKEYFGGLSHHNDIKIGTMFAGSTLLIGSAQIYNKQYWKLPIVYGTIGGGIGAGLYFKNKGDSQKATYCFIGAGVAYWATLMDGVTSYRPSVYPHAGKATLYSLLLPGLGQIYNREYWKLPIYLGGMAYAIHFYNDCSVNFNRYRNIYIESTTEGSGYDGPITSDQALYYRNLYRRYRDYSLLAVAAIYLIQVIDANVFSYMHNFEVNDDLTLKISPAVILPDNQFASSNTSIQNSALGIKFGVSF